MDAKQMRRAVEQLLDSQPDNKRLRDHLEGLCRDPSFAGLTYFWGPRLYARSKAIFRPFILNHFSDWMAPDGEGRWTRVHWAQHATELESWLASARSARDVGLARRLLRWKHAPKNGWQIDQPEWNGALLAAYRSATSPAARAIVLDEFDDWFQLDEQTAVQLYEADRSSAAFIQKHLPLTGWNVNPAGPHPTSAP